MRSFCSRRGVISNVDHIGDLTSIEKRPSSTRSCPAISQAEVVKEGDIAAISELRAPHLRRSVTKEASRRFRGLHRFHVAALRPIDCDSWRGTARSWCSGVGPGWFGIRSGDGLLIAPRDRSLTVPRSRALALRVQLARVAIRQSLTRHERADCRECRRCIGAVGAGARPQRSARRCPPGVGAAPCSLQRRSLRRTDVRAAPR